MKSGSVNQEAGLVQTTTFYEKVATGKLSFYLIVLWLKWFVTQSIREIVENATKPEEIIQGKEALVRYMAWRSPETLNAYEHYFQAAHHTQIQDQLFLRLYEREKQSTETPPKVEGSHQKGSSEARPKQNEQGWETLLALGGISYE